MAEMKLTKAEEQLKKTNPKKFAELMKRRQGSSARKLRLSQQKKAEDAGSRKTTPPGGIAAATLGAGPAAMGIIKLGSGLFKILNDKSNKIFKTVGEAQKAAKQRGKFKVGDKTYNSLAAANKARRAQKVEMKGVGPKPGQKGQTFNVKTKAPDKPNQQQLTGAAKRSKLEAAGRAADKMTKTARGKKITDSAKKAVGPAAVATTAAVAARPKKAAPKPAPKPRSTIADVKKKPKPPVKKQPPPKPVDSGRKAYNKGYETMKEYFVDDMTGRKSRVKTPFGIITIDSSDKGMAFEEYESKYGGQIKGTVKRRMGGKVRGYGKAMRGY